MASQGISFRIFARDDASSTFKKVTREAERSTKTMGRVGAASHGLFASVRSSALAAAAGIGVLGAGSLLKSFIDEARESAKVTRMTEGVIKSTGGAAGITAQQVSKLATAISNKTGVDDEAIQSSENLLLTFVAVRNETGKGNQIFNRATQSIADLTATMNHGQITQDGLKTSTLQLGKALQDPIKGVQALGRAGVQFTAAQKAQIKTMVDSGNTLGAQKIIMGEVERQTAGAAERSGDAFRKLSTIIGNTKQQIGEALLPAVSQAATWLGTNLPGATTRTLAVFSALFGFIRANSSWLVPLTVGVATFAATIKTVLVVQRAWAAAQEAWIGVQAAWLAVTKASTVAQIALNTALYANPVGLIIAAIVGLAAVLVIAYKKSETFRKIVQGAFHAVTAAAIAAWAWIRKNWPVLLGALAGPVGIAAVLITRHWGRIKAGAINAVQSVTSWFSRLPGMISRAVGNLGKLLWSKGADVLHGLWSGMQRKWNSITAWLRRIPGWIKALKGPINVDRKLLVPEGHAIMSGLWEGLKRGASPIGRWLTNVTTGLFSTGALGRGSALLIGRVMAASRGWVGSQWDALQSLWMGESGWNPLARNASSGAFGIPQALPPGKMGAAAVHGNAAAQIQWGLNYIAQRYGTPSAAYRAWLSRSPHWYDKGGFLPPGVTTAVNMTGRPERILSPSETRAYGGGGNTIVINVAGSVTSERDLIRTVRDGILHMARGNGGRVSANWRV